jgi:hypothetical protein
MEEWRYIVHSSCCTRWKLVMSFTSRHPQGKSPQYPSDRKGEGVDAVEKRKISFYCE